jgi:hypothetical protein
LRRVPTLAEHVQQAIKKYPPEQGGGCFCPRVAEKTLSRNT